MRGCEGNKVNMRRQLYRYWPYLLLLPLLFVLAGCGATSGMTPGSSGIGADAGPWPTAPTRNTNTTRPGADEAPDAPVVVILRAKAADNEELRLDVTGVEVKFGGSWFDVAKKSAITAITAMPARVDSNGASMLLSKGMVPKRKYTHFQIRLDDKKTMLVSGNSKIPLTVKSAIIELKEWTPDEKKKVNVLVVTLDGTKITRTAESATLPADAITVQPEEATGAISGKLDPTLPTATIEAFWSGSKTSFGSVAPAAQDGSFTISDLPAGPYTLEIRTPGYRLVKPLKDAVNVETKTVELKDLTLTPDTTQH